MRTFVKFNAYKMRHKKLQMRQLDDRIKPFSQAAALPNPPTGWIKAIRLALGMSMEQLGRKLGMTRQGVHDLEQRETEGNLTINRLREAAKAMDMELVYAVVPREGSLEAYVDQKALELARHIVLRTSDTMRLEDQENAQARIQEAIVERADSIRNDLPKILWD